MGATYILSGLEGHDNLNISGVGCSVHCDAHGITLRDGGARWAKGLGRIGRKAGEACVVDAGRAVLVKTSDVEEILELYTQALERVKTYTTDAVALLQSTTLRVIRKVKRWKSSK